MLALDKRNSRDGERDKAPTGELDYDALLAHYRELGIMDAPMEPHPTKEKKKLSLHATLPGEGKFAKKRGHSAHQEPPEEEPHRKPAAAVKHPQEPAAPAEERHREGPAPVREAAVEPEDPKPGPKPREGKRRWQGIFGRPKPEKHPEPAPAAGEAPPEPPRPKPDKAPALAETPKPEPPRPEAVEQPKPEPPKQERRKPEKEEKAPRAAKGRDRGGEPTILEWAYIEVYYIGIQLMRDINQVRRRLSKLAAWVGEYVPRWFRGQHDRFLRVCTHISDTTLFPYRELARLTGRLSRNLRETEKGKGAFRRKLGLWWQYLRSLGRPLNHIANFVAPIVGITILAATLNYFRGINYALSVEYSGQHLGYIAQESVFYEAQQMVLDRMLSEEYQPPEDSQPEFHIVIADKDNLLDDETLANRILSASLNEVKEADGVYIEGAFLGALEDGNEILVYLDSLLDAYRSGIDHELVQFVKSISVRRGIYPASSVRPLYRITQDMQSDQIRTVEHKVEEGETLATIAEQYNVPVEQLLELNTMLEGRATGTLEDSEDSEDSEEIDPSTIPLLTGERLTINRVSMDLGVKVTRREVYEEEIPYGTTDIEDGRYYKGYAVPISAGVNGLQEVTADVTYIDGEKVGENRIGAPEVLREPVNAQRRVGTMPILTYLDPSSTGSNSYLWPVKGGYVSYGLYGYYGHTGMDIAAPYGTEIRAARDGQVTYATNYAIWPYGKSVVISHGDGAITRYAHCSTVFVTYGQYVRQGDLIGLVGQTGNAYGNHCHFEIRINGVIMNPANFIGNYYPGF